MFRFIWLLLVLGGPPGPVTALAAMADETPASPGLTILVETSAEILETIERAGGGHTRRLLPATDIRQGQVVFYTVTIHNPGTQAAHNVIVTKPVPANTRYVAGSAAAPGAVVTFSIDGGTTFAEARRLLVKDARGIERPAPPERYTHIRWRMTYPLAPGARAYARFRAVFR